MTKEADRTDEVEETSQDGISRRGLLKAGMMAAGGAAALSGASLPLVSSAAKAEVGLGPARKIIWVTHHVGEWNIALEVGFLDFCGQAGWTFQKIGVPGGAWSAEENVNRIKQAIQAKPDVIVAPILDLAVEEVLIEAEEAGILVLVNNTHIDEVRDRHVNWGYVGATGHAQGLIIGRTLIPDLIKSGVTGGVLAFGNHAPASPFLTARKQGIADAAEESNERDGTSFVVEEFLDHADDMAQSIPLYSTKIERPRGRPRRLHRERLPEHGRRVSHAGAGREGAGRDPRRRTGHRTGHHRGHREGLHRLRRRAGALQSGLSARPRRLGAVGAGQPPADHEHGHGRGEQG